jgi:hypothetical protein
MKTWWKAVCDEHKEMCSIFVDSIKRTALYLSDRDATITAWMALHRDCKLRLIHHDEDLDACFNVGYQSVVRRNTPPATPWAAMTPREIWDLFTTGHKMAGPWEYAPSMQSDARRSIDGRIIATPMSIQPIGLPPAWPFRIPVPTKDRAGADAILREHGWLLVD